MTDIYLKQVQGLSYFFKNDKRVIVFNHETTKSHVISDSAYHILNSLDGSHSTADLAAQFRDYSTIEIQTLLDKFIEYGLCVKSDDNSHSFTALDAFKQGRIIISRQPESKYIIRSDVFQRVFRVVLLLSPFTAVVQLPPLLQAIQRHGVDLHVGYAILAVFTFLWSLCFHELAHGVFAKSYNANIGEFGLQFQISLCFIRFYTTICGFSYIHGRYQKFNTHIAGILSNFCTISLSSLLLYTNNEALIKIAIVIILINYLCAMTDALPYRGSDGYKALVALFR